MEVEAWTDGSCLHNPGPGGWGVVFVSGGKVVDRLSRGYREATNNQMELAAAIAAMSHATGEGWELTAIHSDSQYVILGASQWVEGWQKNGWRASGGKPVKNDGQWKTLLALKESMPGIRWRWVKGHAGIKHNEAADRLAKEATPK